MRLCDSFGLPSSSSLMCLDTSRRQAGGRGHRPARAKLLHAFAAAHVPRFTVITHQGIRRRVHRDEQQVPGATKVLAWPTAVVDVMSAQAAVKITRRRDIAALPEHGRDEAIAEFAAEHSEIVGGLERAVEGGIVDEVINPTSRERRSSRFSRKHPPSVPDRKHPTMNRTEVFSFTDGLGIDGETVWL